MSENEHAEWLFLQTWDALERDCDRWRELSVIDRITMGGALRKLLMDARPLAVSANRRIGLKLRFRAHAYDYQYWRRLPASLLVDLVKSGGPEWLFQGGAVIPGVDTTPVRELTLKGWLNHVTGQAAGTYVHVKDLIRYVSHVAGGVHAGEPTTPLEELLHRYAHIDRGSEPGGTGLPVDGTPVGLMVGIGKVTMEGLRPLASALRAPR